MNLTDFASQLPRPEARYAIAEDATGFAYFDEPRPDFVAPPLTAVNVPEQARAALITAPAAAGKSTSAEAIARISGGLFIDLAGKRVADGSFLGLIDEALNEDDALHFRKEVRSGRQTLILDALDEANLAAGDTSFVAFVRGLCRFLRTSEGNSNVVLMSRVETAEWIKYVFEEENVELAEFGLSYFSLDQSFQFLDLKLDALYEREAKAPLHRRHASMYKPARDAVLNQLSNAMGYEDLTAAWKQDDGRRFLGYSPVLEGIASYLCVDDFRSLESATGSEAGAGPAEWKFLVDLLSRLLVREQQKFQNSWLDEVRRPMFENASEAARVYGTLEQCDRLSALVELGISHVELPGPVPDAIEASYSQSVDTQLRNHPFLASNSRFASPIFRDFVAAVTLLDGAPDQRRAQLLRMLRRSSNSSTPFLGSFLLTLSTDVQKTALPADLLDLVISSLATRADHGVSYDFDIDLHDGSGTMRISVSHGDVQTFPLSARTAVMLPARVRNIRIDTDVEVIISGSSLRIGPSVRVAAPMISMRGNECAIDAHDSVLLKAGWILADWDQTVTINGRNLTVQADEGEGWVQRNLQPLPAEAEAEESTAVARALRRVIRMFGRSQHTPADELSADATLLYSFVLRTDVGAQRIVEMLTSSGYLRKSGPEYRLRQVFFADMHMNYQLLTDLHFSEQLQEYLASIDV